MAIKNMITREQFFNFVKTDKDIEGNISSPTQHYLDYFDQYKKTGKSININWASVLPLWWWYRRMALNAVAFCMIQRPLDGALCKLNEKFFPGTAEIFIETVGVLLLLAFMAMSADYLYLHHACKKVSKGTTTSGVSKRNVIIVAIIGMVGLFVKEYLKI